MPADEENLPSVKRQKLNDPTSGSGSQSSPITLSPASPVSPGSPASQESPFTLSPHSLFYLTRVRGVESQYNEPHMAVGIRGVWLVGCPSRCPIVRCPDLPFTLFAVLIVKCLMRCPNLRRAVLTVVHQFTGSHSIIFISRYLVSTNG